MPEESTTPDLEAATRLFREALNRRDFEAAVALYGPEAVWNSADGLLGLVEGREAIRDALEGLVGAFEDFETAGEEFRDFGHGVTLSVNLHRGRPRGGGGGFVELRAAAVSIWAGGLIERITLYTDIDEARAAAERLAEERG